MTPTWFMGAILCLNLGAAVTFALESRWPWTLIYAGAGLIQLGCLWANR